MANHRLFVALEPPEPVRRRLAALSAGLRRSAGRAADELRWVSDDNLHLTLQFLGAVPDERVDAVLAAVAAAAAAGRPLSLEVKGAGGFPNARRPRVIWLGLGGEAAALGPLAEDLGRRLAPLGFPPEGRPFSAHLTVARARDPRGAPGLGGALAAAAQGDGVPWRAAELVLFESHLSPRGPSYEVRLRAPLGG
ncbi:MAG: RNA 2',3'-cyclic phosphodiesterase [Anaeromyxobacter sp.]